MDYETFSVLLSSRRESDCGSMPGAEELCREESNSGSDTSNSMDYNLYSATSMNDNDGDATNTVDYSDFYSLSGTDQNSKLTYLVKVNSLKICF